MEDVLDIGEVAQTTGLSLRALRFYEARGLVRPIRTAGGRRVYGRGELARLSAVVALKRAGFPLKKIGDLLGGRQVDLPRLVAAQLAELDARAVELEESRTLLRSISSRIDRGEPIDVATLCSLIRSGEATMNQETWQTVVDRHFPADQKARWAEVSGSLPGDHASRLEALKAKIVAQLPLDPRSADAQSLLEEWTALTSAISKVADPDLIERLRTLVDEFAKLPRDAQPPIDLTAVEFIRVAALARSQQQ